MFFNKNDFFFLSSSLLFRKNKTISTTTVTPRTTAVVVYEWCYYFRFISEKSVMRKIINRRIETFKLEHYIYGQRDRSCNDRSPRTMYRYTSGRRYDVQVRSNNVPYQVVRLFYGQRKKNEKMKKYCVTAARFNSQFISDLTTW